MVALATTLNQELVNAKLRCAESEAERAQLRREFKRVQSEMMQTAGLEAAIEAAAASSPTTPSRPSSRSSSPAAAAAAASLTTVATTPCMQVLTTAPSTSIEPGAPQHGARHGVPPHEAEPSLSAEASACAPTSAVSSAGAPTSAVSSAPPTPMAQRLMATLAKSEARGPTLELELDDL